MQDDRLHVPIPQRAPVGVEFRIRAACPFAIL
jgi:hypothetical protein